MDVVDISRSVEVAGRFSRLPDRSRQTLCSYVMGVRKCFLRSVVQARQIGIIFEVVVSHKESYDKSRWCRNHGVGIMASESWGRNFTPPIPWGIEVLRNSSEHGVQKDPDGHQHLIGAMSPFENVWPERGSGNSS